MSIIHTDTAIDRGAEWYAVVVRPRSEKVVAHSLTSKGVENYLPVYRGRYRSAGNFKDVDLPLFPQYVFCRPGSFKPGYVLGTQGVFRFVVFGGKPAAVDTTELENIRRAESAGTGLQPWPFLQVGDYAEMCEGPLRGLAGRLITVKGESKLILDILLLQRSVSVTVERRWIRPCSAPVPIRKRAACAAAGFDYRYTPSL
jgi:transcription antitermination factor NusG